MNFLILLSPFLSCLILIFLFKLFAVKRGILFDASHGDGLKTHHGIISMVGGPAMFFSFLIGLVAFETQQMGFKVALIIVSSSAIFLLGIFDDINWKQSSKSKPILKFSFLILITLFSAVVLFFANTSFGFFPLKIVAIILSFIYVFAAINAVNYQDGIDGLAGGLVLVSFIGFAIAGFSSGNNFALNTSLICAGSVAAFLIFNFPPARIFMGDSGAYFLGFVLAFLAMTFSKPYNVGSVLGPILIIGMPLIDGIYTNIRRILAKKSIFYGDRDHFYDKLLRKFSIKNTLGIAYGLQILLVVIGLIIYYV